jgi:hypothetical protein
LSKPSAIAATPVDDALLPALRAGLLALGLGLLLGVLALSGCTGPGLEPPKEGAGGGDFGSGHTDGGSGPQTPTGGAGGSSAPGNSGAGGRGEMTGGTGGLGGEPSEPPTDAGLDGGIDEDAGALR